MVRGKEILMAWQVGFLTPYTDAAGGQGRERFVLVRNGAIALVRKPRPLIVYRVKTA